MPHFVEDVSPAQVDVQKSTLAVRCLEQEAHRFLLIPSRLDIDHLDSIIPLNLNVAGQIVCFIVGRKHDLPAPERFASPLSTGVLEVFDKGQPFDGLFIRDCSGAVSLSGLFHFEFEMSSPAEFTDRDYLDDFALKIFTDKLGG